MSQVRSEFRVQDVALTGFGLVRAHPRALLAWAPLSLAFSLAVSVAATRGPQGPFDPSALAQDPQAAMAWARSMFPFLVFAGAIAMVVNAVLYAAMMRAVLAPRESRFGYLRLGPDELRQLVLQALTFVVLFGVYLAVLIAGTLFTALGALAGDIARIVFAGVAVVAAAAILLVAAVRLSLAVPLTFASGRVNLFGSWALTRGRFWPIFLSYLLSGALVLFVIALGAALEFAVTGLIAPDAAASGPASGAAMAPATLSALFTPAALAGAAVNAIISALIWPVMFTPPAAIFQRLSALDPAVLGEGSRS